MMAEQQTPSPVPRDFSALRKTARQFLKFGMIGAIGFAVDSVMLYFGIYVLGMGRVVAGFFSFPFAVTSTWIGNRRFTFRDARHASAVTQLAKFAAVCAIGLVFNRGTYTLLVTYVPVVYAHPILGLVAGTGVSMFFNFFATRRHVFGA
jgi:putative flippase GtrA